MSAPDKTKKPAPKRRRNLFYLEFHEKQGHDNFIEPANHRHAAWLGLIFANLGQNCYLSRCRSVKYLNTTLIIKYCQAKNTQFAFVNRFYIFFKISQKNK